MKKAYNVIFLVIILEITGTYTSNDVNNKYCYIRSCQYPDPSISKFPLYHTGCAFEIGQPGSTCTDYFQVLKIGLSLYEEMDILYQHNVLRERVASGLEVRGNPGPQPRAISIPLLTWDVELARLAQTWANQCTDGVDQCRDVERFKVNQLALVQKFSNLTVQDSPSSMFEHWRDEVNFLDYRKLPNYEYDPDTIDYTQLVWANTTKIGCGYIEIARKNQSDPESKKNRSISLSDGIHAKILVCNYGPAGNVIGEDVYDIDFFNEYPFLD